MSNVKNINDFSAILDKTITTIDKDAESKEAIQAFKEFVKEDLPKGLDAYEWTHDQVLLQVFKYRPNTDASIKVNLRGDTSSDIDVRFMSFAKVLATGPKSQYKPNDIVKLKDIDTLTLENPQYAGWVSNPMSKSNLKQKGEEPQRFVNNIYKAMGAATFIINPFDLEKLDRHIDDSVYKLFDAKIENKVVNIDALF